MGNVCLCGCGWPKNDNIHCEGRSVILWWGGGLSLLGSGGARLSGGGVFCVLFLDVLACKGGLGCDCCVLFETSVCLIELVEVTITKWSLKLKFEDASLICCFNYDCMRTYVT